MAKSNETHETTGSLQWRINYQYIAKNGQLRGGAAVIEAATAAEAQTKGAEMLLGYGLKGTRITSCKIY